MTSGATWDLRSEALQTFSVEVENTQKTAQLIGAQLHENFQKAQLLQSELTCIITTSIEKILEAPPPACANYSSTLKGDGYFDF